MFPAFVGITHRAAHVEDQLVQGATFVKAINPLARHADYGFRA